jgi:hypothetical protein
MDETTRPIPEVGSSTILVEHAQPEDAEEIMRIKRAAWIAAYPNEDYDVSTVDVQNKFTEEDVITGTQNWQNGIAGETDAGKRWTFVARLGGKVVGFSSPAIEDGQRNQFI